MHSAKVSAQHPQQAPLPRQRLRPGPLSGHRAFDLAMAASSSTVGEILFGHSAPFPRSSSKFSGSIHQCPLLFVRAGGGFDGPVNRFAARPANSIIKSHAKFHTNGPEFLVNFDPPSLLADAFDEKWS